MIAQLACKFIIYQEESECIGENNQIKKKKEKKKQGRKAAKGGGRGLEGRETH